MEMRLALVFAVAVASCVAWGVAAARDDEYIEGVSEFLIDRASDNAIYIFERKARENPFIRVFFPNTFSYLSNASFRQLFLSKEFLRKNVDKDVDNILRESLLLYAYDKEILKKMDTDRVVSALKEIDNGIEEEDIRNALDNINKLIAGVEGKEEIYIRGKRIREYSGLYEFSEQRKQEIKRLLDDEAFSGEAEGEDVSIHYEYLFSAIDDLRRALIVALENSDSTYSDDMIGRAKKKANDRLVKNLAMKKYKDAAVLVSSYHAIWEDRDKFVKILKMASFIELVNNDDEEPQGDKKITNFEKVLEAEKQIAGIFTLSIEEERKKVITDSYCVYALCDAEEVSQAKKDISEKIDLKYTQASAEYRSFRQIIILLAQLSDAETSDQVRELLSAATLPSVSFGEKRIPGKHSFFISSYLGSAVQYDDSRGSDVALFVPVGLEYAYGCTQTSRFLSIPSLCPKGYAMSVMLGVFDFSVPVNLSLYDRDDEVSLKDVLQPGLYFSLGPRNYPVVFGFGVARGRLYGDSVDSVGDEKDTRYLIFLSFDMPLFAL